MNGLKVKLLVLTTCLQCNALKELLTKHKVDYESTDVDLLVKDDRDELFAEMKDYNAKKAFPVTFIGQDIIIGYQKSLILDTLGLN
ncbi:MAG: glutaredoxin family protein [Desulfofustis sp.]|nr:glutaredoxin family protein [Desulfofustis sp.]